VNGPRTQAPFGRRSAEVTGNEPVGAYRLISVLDTDGPRDPRPGQFYMLSADSCWGGGADERPYLPRAFSHARAREDGTLQFFLEAIGPGTARLAELEPGEGLGLVGPLGIGFAPGPAEEALLVGGGIGAAPLLCLRDELGEGARVLLGFRSAEHALGAALFADARVATDDGSVGHHGFVTELLREELDRGPAPTVYACGPPPMLEAVRALCAEREVPVQLALESGMACGYGACFGCVVPTRNGYVRLCVDGPVLAGEELDSALVPGAPH
jgi:dihydroorotate dehydrogenase electron transfer subunit